MNTILEQINSAGYAFVEFALPMLVQSSVLILILLLVDFVLRKKVRAVFRYCIWMLVLVKLVLPTSLSSPMSLGYWFGAELQSIKISDTAATVEVAVMRQMAKVAPTEVASAAPSAASTTMDVEPVAAEDIARLAASVRPVTWQGAVFLVWLGVVIVMGLLLLQRAMFVSGLVAQAKNANGLMNDTLKFCCGQMGIKSKVRLKVSANATSPAVCGLFSPVILVPSDLGPSLGSSHLRSVLLHELAHIKRGDLWVNLAQTVLQIAYFYNPLLWLANSIIRRVREQAVDEMVLVAMGEKARQYPQTLVDVAKLAFKRPALSLRLIGVVESKSTLKVRIKHMLNRPMPKSAKLGILGLIVVFVAGCVLLPMAAAAKKEVAAEDDTPKQSQFTATLSNGVTVELVGVCEHPSEGKKWWRPDGSLLKETMGIKIYGRLACDIEDAFRGKPYAFVVRIDGPTDLNFKWGQTQDTRCLAQGKVIDEQGREVKGMQAIQASIDEQKVGATLRLAVASGPWQNEAAHSGRGIMGTGRKQGAVMFSEAYESDKGVKITVSDDLNELEHRIAAVDAEGNVLGAVSKPWVGVGKMRQTVAHFKNLGLKQIKEFQFQTRPYEWVEFKNVSLKPGVKTDVQVGAGLTPEEKAGKAATPEEPERGRADVSARQAEIAAKLENLQNQRARVQRDLDSAERALDEVRARFGFTDLEEHSYPHPVTSRLMRLEQERDDCVLEIAQLQPKIKNLEKQVVSPKGQENLKKARESLIVLRSKLKELEEMREGAVAQKRELDLARVKYKQRANIRDERKQMLNTIKSQMGKLKIMYGEPETSEVQVEVEKAVPEQNDKQSKWLSDEIIHAAEFTKPAKPARRGRRAPVVVSTIPAAFADDVPPSLKRITVTFDQPMMDGSWSWTGGGDTFPERKGPIYYDSSNMTCSMPVKLKPGKAYLIGINGPSHKNFQTTARVPAREYVIVFATKNVDGKPTAIPEDMLAYARKINSRSEQSKQAVSTKTADLHLNAAPWVDGEVMRLNLNTMVGMEIGTIIYTAESVMAAEKKAWRVESYMAVPINNMQQFTRVEAERDSFTPITGRTKNQLGDFKAKYRPDKVELTFAAGDKETVREIEIEDVVYDNEQAIYLIRRLPLKEGYQAKFPIFSVQGGTVVDSVIQVAGKEKLTAPAGTFDCYKTTLAAYSGTIKALEHKLWFSADEHQYLVKYDSGAAIMELAEVGVKQNRPQNISDEGLNLSITIPADWHCYKSTSVGRYKFMLKLLAPELKADVMLLCNERASQVSSVLQIAEADVEILKGYFKDYAVRADSWTQAEIGGLAAAQYAADYLYKGKAMVEYRTYLLGKSMVYWFVFRIEKDEFESNKDEFDSIVNSFKLRP